MRFAESEISKKAESSGSIRHEKPFVRLGRAGIDRGSRYCHDLRSERRFARENAGSPQNKDYPGQRRTNQCLGHDRRAKTGYSPCLGQPPHPCWRQVAFDRESCFTPTQRRLLRQLPDGGKFLHRFKRDDFSPRRRAARHRLSNPVGDV